MFCVLFASASPAFPICTASLVSFPCSTDFSFLGTITFLTGLASSFSSVSAASSLLSGWISNAMPSWVLAERGLGRGKKRGEEEERGHGWTCEWWWGGRVWGRKAEKRLERLKTDEKCNMFFFLQEEEKQQLLAPTWWPHVLFHLSRHRGADIMTTINSCLYNLY